MLRFVKSLWIATLAAAATFTSCVRMDAGNGLQGQTKQGQPPPAAVSAAVAVR